MSGFNTKSDLIYSFIYLFFFAFFIFLGCLLLNNRIHYTLKTKFSLSSYQTLNAGPIRKVGYNTNAMITPSMTLYLGGGNVQLHTIQDFQINSNYFLNKLRPEREKEEKGGGGGGERGEREREREREREGERERERGGGEKEREREREGEIETKRERKERERMRE